MVDSKAKPVMVTVTGSITLDEHRSFRSQSSLAGLSAKDAVTLAIREWLAARSIMPKVTVSVSSCSGGGVCNFDIIGAGGDGGSNTSGGTGGNGGSADDSNPMD